MIVDQSKLPLRWPVNRLDDVFWTAFGQAVGTFGHLEWTLKQAIFQLEGSRAAPEDEEDRRITLEEWGKRLEGVVVNTLKPLAADFERVAKAHEAIDSVSVREIVIDVLAASDVRNALCHANWQAQTPFSAKAGYVDRRLNVLDTVVDVAFLQNLQAHVAGLAASVISTVTATGVGFPGLVVPYK